MMKSKLLQKLTLTVFRPTPVAVVTIFSLALSSYAQNAELSASAQATINSIMDVKSSFNSGEQKLSTNLVLASRQALGKSLGAASNFVNPNIKDASGMVQIVIRGNASTALLSEIAARGGSAQAVAPSNDRIEASVPLMQLEGLAGNSDVSSIRQPPQKRTNAGSLTSQGYITHTANQAVGIGQTGAGVKVGVLSDSASAARVAFLQSTGDLGPGTTVLTGQSGAPGSDEGTAMMEIVQDLAPGTQIFFATAFSGESQFAANIIALGVAGCKVAVDDVSYDDEPPFQDGTIAQGVNAFVAGGGIYFSSAGNDGGKTNNNSTVWEGDFKDGGAYTGPVNPSNTKSYIVHDFGTGQLNNQLLQVTRAVPFFWADPQGGSTNDYDVFVTDSAGTTVKGFSTDTQNGTQDPFEEVVSTALGGNWTSPAAGDRIVLVRVSTSARVAIRVASLFGESQLAITTPGTTEGHNAGANTQCVAATFWNSAHKGTKPFNGTNNPIEVFSSDGPRKIFFNPNGTAITPGNFLFATNGGTTLQKPDFTAADGVTTRTGGTSFDHFFGTSAASPHAAAIAALIRGANPALTNTQVSTIMHNTALDNMAPGPDRDGGVGVVTAFPAVQAALAPPVAPAAAPPAASIATPRAIVRRAIGKAMNARSDFNNN